MKTNRIPILAGALMLATVAHVTGQEKPPSDREMRERMAAEEVEAVRREARMAIQAEESRRDGQTAEAREIEAARRSAVAREARDHDMSRHLHGDAPEPPRQRIEHLQQAARHLEQAGFPEQAKRLRAEIRKLDAQQRTKRERGRAEAAGEGMRREIEALKREVKDLRQELRKLRAEIGRGAQPSPADAPEKRGGL